MPNIHWTPEDDAVVRADALAGVPAAVTAARIGRGVPATYNRRIKLDVVLQPKTKASAEDLATLRVMVSRHPPATDGEIAVALGWDTGRVRHYVRDLDLVGVRTRGVRPGMRPSPPFRAAVPARAPAAPTSSLGRPVVPAPRPVRVADPGAAAAPGPGALRLEAATREAARREADRAELVAEQARLFARLAEEERARVEAAAAAAAAACDVREREAARAAALARREEEARTAALAKAARDDARRLAAEERGKAAALRREAAALRPAARKPAGVPAVVRPPSFVGRASGPVAPAGGPVAPVAVPVVSVPAVVASAVAAAVPAPAAVVPAQAPAAARAAPVVLLEPAPRRDPGAAPARPNWAHGRGGGRPRGPAPTRFDALALSSAAGDAVARFIAERGVTRVEPQGEVDAAVAALRRRGYVVLADGAGHRVDGRPVADIMAFARERRAA